MNNDQQTFSNFGRDINSGLNIQPRTVVIEPRFDATSLAKSLVEQLRHLNDLQASSDSDPFVNEENHGRLENMMAEGIRTELSHVSRQPEELTSLGAALRDLGAQVEIGFNSMSESQKGWIKIGWNGLSRSTNLYVAITTQSRSVALCCA
jgi:hypothetical protein